MFGPNDAENMPNAMPVSIPRRPGAMTPGEFIAKWRDSELARVSVGCERKATMNVGLEGLKALGCQRTRTGLPDGIGEEYKRLC